MRAFLLDAMVLWFDQAPPEEGNGRPGPRRVNEPSDLVWTDGAHLSEVDRPLWEGVRAGDLAAFESVFRLHHAVLCDFVSRYVGGMEAAQDIVEEVFAALWVRREQWVPRAGIRAYLFGAVRNRALATVRDERRRENIGHRIASEPEAEDDHSVQEDARERLAQVWAAVGDLPETQRAVVTMRWRAGLSFEDIGVALGTSTAAVKMHASRAMRILRDRLR